MPQVREFPPFSQKDLAGGLLILYSSTCTPGRATARTGLLSSDQLLLSSKNFFSASFCRMASW